MGTKPIFLLLTEHCCRPDQTRLVVPTVEASTLIELSAEFGLLIGRVRSCWRRSGTSLDSIGCCTLCVRSSSAAASGHAENIAVTKNNAIGASGHCFAQRPVTAVDTYCCRATDRTRPVPIRAAPGHLCRARFFTIFHPAWFLSSCLDFAWFLGSSIVLLGSCLRC